MMGADGRGNEEGSKEDGGEEEDGGLHDKLESSQQGEGGCSNARARRLGVEEGIESGT